MAAPAQALTPVWSSTATACVADAVSIELNRYTTTFGRVAHRATNKDPIQLFCPITSPQLEGSDWTLVVTYRDSTGTSTSASVKAQLLRISRSTGGQAFVTTFTSDSSAFTGTGQGSIGFTHDFNFSANYYYVLITLDRTLTSETVQAVGVAIEPFFL